MKHVLILRALGCVLVIALAVNITAVLAAPLYLNSSDPRAAASPADKQDAKPTTSTEPAFADVTTDNLIVIKGDVVQSEDPSQTVEDHPGLEAAVQSASERVLFELGTQIGLRSQQRPVVAAIQRFLRRSPTTTAADVEDDLLPTVVITGTELERPNVTESFPDVDGPTDPSVKRIVLENPTENGYTVRFQVDGAVQTLKPGAVLIEMSTRSVIRFDRGGSFGVFRQELSPGHYRFRVTREGWKLDEASAASL